ncbi:MAG: ComEC/Rec2 family competence protein [Bacteroidota bacterium]
MAACLATGILLGFYTRIASGVLLFLFPSLLVLLFVAMKKQSRNGLPFFELTFILTFLAIGVFTVKLHNPNSLANLQDDQSYSWVLKIKEILKPNSYNQRYLAQVMLANNEPQQGRLILSFPRDSLKRNLNVDDEVIVHGQLLDIPPTRNPHQFDYRAYLKKQGIQHQLKSNGNGFIVRDAPSRTLLGYASEFRNHIISKLRNEGFGPSELGVIQALLLGYRGDISADVYDDYKNAGAVHILAVSGLHVGILLLFLQFLFTPLSHLPKGKILKLLVIVLSLWVYAFIAGLSPSIVRAVTMFSFLAYAMHLNRPTNTFNILALSLFFTLLLKPLFLFQVGFQMSYAAVFAIVWLYPKLERFWTPENLIIRKVWQLLSISVSAQMGVLPISLFYFHQFPALFFVSNLLVVPFLGLLLGCGILVIVLSLLDILPNILMQGYDLAIQGMNTIVGWVGQQERFLIRDIPFDSVQLVLGYLFLISLVHYLAKPKRKTLVQVAIGILLFQSWSLRNQKQVNGKETLILGHQSKQTVLLHQQGKQLRIFASDTTSLPVLVKNYQVAERLKSVSKHPLQNSYAIGQKRIYVLDSSGIYPKDLGTDYLLLTQSPKVNLDRLLRTIQPKTVIADGSNYTSFVKRWKVSCIKKNIPFHSTREKGYFVFDMGSD